MKAQLSLELLLVLAAYAAFLALLSQSASQGFQGVLGQGGQAGKISELNAACFYVGLFTADGSNTLVSRNFSEYSAEGKKLFLGNASVSCPSEVRFENGLLKVDSLLPPA